MLLDEPGYRPSKTYSGYNLLYNSAQELVWIRKFFETSRRFIVSSPAAELLDHDSFKDPEKCRLDSGWCGTKFWVHKAIFSFSNLVFAFCLSAFQQNAIKFVWNHALDLASTNRYHVVAIAVVIPKLFFGRCCLHRIVDSLMWHGSDISALDICLRFWSHSICYLSFFQRRVFS